MTPANYIIDSLNTLKTTDASLREDETIEDAIYRLLMSKKFRKYSAQPHLIEHIKNAIKINVEKQEPINATFLHGAYKLWRLEESPSADWAELFAAMYYTNWLAPICSIYKPGVWFDYFVDDLIIPKLNNIPLEDVTAYRKSFQAVLDFLKPYQPDNMRMTITGVGDQFDSSESFDEKLANDVQKYAQQFPSGLPEVTESRSIMINLNRKPSETDQNNPDWKAKNVLMHDAYIKLTKFETGYHLQPNKILTFNQSIPGLALGLGTTKTSIAKFWAGVGTLKKDADSYRQYILSPKQIETNKITTEQIAITGLTGKNFTSIRIIDSE